MASSRMKWVPKWLKYRSYCTNTTIFARLSGCHGNPDRIHCQDIRRVSVSFSESLPNRLAITLAHLSWSKQTAAAWGPSLAVSDRVVLSTPRLDCMASKFDRTHSEFAELLREAHHELFGFIFAMLQNRADAEDIYQQTSMVLWRKFATFEPGTNFVAWAIRVAQFEIKDYVKARRRRKVFFNDEILDAIAERYQAESSEFRERRLEALANCIDKLSERDRNLLNNCYAVERDYSKIARAEGKTLGAVYQAICRIRKALHMCVQRSLAAAE
jgi:RNA polymerase sigma-70 factor, ECF subfamily